MLMIKGFIYGSLVRHRLSTKSSTEDNLVVVSNLLPKIFLPRDFLKYQGCAINKSKIYLDNQSNILLYNNS